MQAKLVRTEPAYSKQIRYVYSCANCGAEFSRLRYDDRINPYCGNCKAENDRILNAERVARKKATHDAEIFNGALDELNTKIKEHWLFRGSDGNVYREIIDDLVKELRK